MMPWYAWVYLALLALIGASGLRVSLKMKQSLWPALLPLAAIVVFGGGVVLFFRGSGAGMVFAFALFAATLLQARKAVADANAMRTQPLPAASRIGVALGALTLLPAIALGALAVWTQQSG